MSGLGLKLCVEEFRLLIPTSNPPVSFHYKFWIYDFKKIILKNVFSYKSILLPAI
jgi:uncharacterized protein YcfL